MKRDKSKIAALILAAGYSSRMGDFKPLLPLGQSRVIERAVSSFLRAGIQDVRVVVGYRAEALIPILDHLGVKTIPNVHYDSGMYSSLVAGVRSLDPEVEAFFLLPGDHPLVKPQTVQDLIDTYQGSQAGIIYPCFLQWRGHPPLIATLYIDEILSGEPLGGLRVILTRHEDAALNVEVADQGVLLDVDTPEDYQKALAYSLREDIPTQQECHMILRKSRVSQEVIGHVRSVAHLAQQWAILLNQRGFNLDLDLIVAAGWLHDLAKGQPDHARKAARMLSAWGYPRVAKIVAVHMDILLEVEQPLDEAQIIYLADKVALGTCVVSLSEKFGPCFERFADQPEVMKAVTRRLKNAEAIKARLEAVLGIPLEATLEVMGQRSIRQWIAG
jgi:CTP:molybdopterin cytidylyltransferase MocA/5'-deoxynucleotidase YfbR-like HD superfamily hydrolase